MTSQNTHVLIATGASLLPQLEIAVYAYTDGDAMGEAKRYAAALHPAGYFRFHLYIAHPDHGNSLVAEFKVTQPALIVETK